MRDDAAPAVAKGAHPRGTGSSANIYAGMTGLAPFTQGLGWAHPAHIRTGTGRGAPARAIGPERASISRVKLCAEAFAARMALIAAHVRFICASATPRLPNDWTNTA